MRLFLDLGDALDGLLGLLTASLDLFRLVGLSCLAARALTAAILIALDSIIYYYELFLFRLVLEALIGQETRLGCLGCLGGLVLCDTCDTCDTCETCEAVRDL